MDDLPLLTKWQTKPHVRRWWESDAPYDAKDLADPRVARWIVSLDDRPFAFMQDYTVHGWDDHHFRDLPKGARGIDQFIGVADMVGCGHGSSFIKQHMIELLGAGAPIVATDPHPDNERAIAAYKKVGFQSIGPVQETKWGLILPMATLRQGHQQPAPRSMRDD